MLFAPAPHADRAAPEVITPATMNDETASLQDHSRQERHTEDELDGPSPALFSVVALPSPPSEFPFSDAMGSVPCFNIRERRQQPHGWALEVVDRVGDFPRWTAIGKHRWIHIVQNETKPVCSGRRRRA